MPSCHAEMLDRRFAADLIFSLEALKLEKLWVQLRELSAQPWLLGKKSLLIFLNLSSVVCQRLGCEVKVVCSRCK